MRNAAWIAGVCLLALGALAASRAGTWTEEDFPPRTVRELEFSDSDDVESSGTVVGVPTAYRFRKGDTLHDVARHLGLGINEVTDAMPHLDVWLPPSGQERHFPTWWVLPESRREGIVINLPEMRLYYFPPKKKGVVITYPVGLGRDEWQTPTGEFRITEKTKDPTWVIPRSIREERIREKGRYERAIPGGDPQNPLGRYRLRLSLPLYGIHGTNIPWGVGMKVSHGCIRLYPEDIEQLFPIVPVGSPGELVYQPVKVGARHGRVYVEIHEAIYDERYDYWNEASAIIRARGWDTAVDWGKLADAIDRKSGVPTRVSVGFDSQPPKPSERVEADAEEISPAES